MRYDCGKPILQLYASSCLLYISEYGYGICGYILWHIKPEEGSRCIIHTRIATLEAMVWIAFQFWKLFTSFILAFQHKMWEPLKVYVQFNLKLSVLQDSFPKFIKYIIQWYFSRGLCIYLTIKESSLHAQFDNKILS